MTLLPPVHIKDSRQVQAVQREGDARSASASFFFVPFVVNKAFYHEEHEQV